MQNFHRVLFADLDDTLFRSGRKCAEAAGLEPAAYSRDGSACSFTTPMQRAFLGFVNEAMTVIPTTARNIDAFRRIPFRFSSYAILDYGGIVLHPDGTADQAWLAEMRSAVEVALPGLEEVGRIIDAYAHRTGLQGRTRIVTDLHISFYLVYKDPGNIGRNLVPLAREIVKPWIAASGGLYNLHLNDNNLAVLPAALNKARAVAYVSNLLRAQHEHLMTFGIGDSISDACFMSACDYAIVPAGTQLARSALGAT